MKLESIVKSKLIMSIGINSDGAKVAVLSIDGNQKSVSYAHTFKALYEMAAFELKNEAKNYKERQII